MNRTVGCFSARHISILCVFIALFSCYPCSAQTGQAAKITLDFRNQKISDILLALAGISGQSIIVDDTVTGTATFHFADDDFDSAINRFAEYANLFIEKKPGAYYVTKARVVDSGGGYYSVEAEDVPLEPLIKILSRVSKKTIVYDPLPSGLTTIRTERASLEEILRLMLIRYADYGLVSQEGGFYISRNAGKPSDDRVSTAITLNVSDDLYSLSVQKTTLVALVNALFKKAGREYSLLNKTAVNMDNLYFENKTFDQLLKLIMEQAGCDFTIENGVYYIFEIQKKDILKKLKTTEAVKLNYISVTDVMNLIPAELNAGSFTKPDKASNTLYVTGSEDEIAPIIDFLRRIDIPADGRYYACFPLSRMSVKDVAAIIPKNMLFTDIVVIPDTNSFVTQVTAESGAALREFLTLVDKKNQSYPIRLRYIHSEELMKFLPPSADKTQITLSGDTSLVFYTGTEEGFTRFIRDLELLDQPKQQIRYQILVIQYQKNTSLNWKAGITISKNDGDPFSNISGTLSNLLNIKFDIVSQFGVKFAAELNAELGDSRAKLLADTTLNSISGGDVKFQNTNTYRYRDVTLDPNTGVYTGTTREVSSGLIIKINGWVSGDGMITVNVDAQVSKQGAITKDSQNNIDNPPPTTEKSVTTLVRTRSGSPIILGGLLQTEKDVTIKKVPVLGSIPFLGNLFRSQVVTEADTEMVIYLVPFVEHTAKTSADYDKKIRSYCQKYVSVE